MKTKISSTSLFVAFAGSCFSTLATHADAFSLDRTTLSSTTTRESRSHRHTPLEQSRGAKIESKTKIFMQDPLIQEVKSSAEEGESQTTMEKDVERTDVKDTVRKVWKKVGLSAVYGFSFIMNIIGLYFTVGLLLNLSGYAYEFSFEEGYKIDTIENKRIQRQFEQQSKRYEREHVSKLSIGKEAATTFNSETVAELSEIIKD